MKKLWLLLVCFGLLSGCAARVEPVKETEMPVSAQTQEQNEDPVILTVEDRPVYWSEFNYYLTYISNYYKSANGIDEITDWSVRQDGKPLEEYFLDYAVSLSKNHRGLVEKAEELGCGITAQQEAAIDETIADGETVYGSGEYRRMVEESYNAVENFRFLQEIGFLTDNVFVSLYGDRGELCGDDTVAEYAEENDYMCVKFICVEDTEENRRLMEELSARLTASDDRDMLFDEMMDEYSRYTTLNSADFPQGQLFGKGYLGDAFDQGYAALSDGEISGVCPGPNELYIIQRLPLDPDGAKNQGGFTLRHCVAYALFEQDMESWGSELECTFEDGYYEIDVRSFE